MGSSFSRSLLKHVSQHSSDKVPYDLGSPPHLLPRAEMLPLEGAAPAGGYHTGSPEQGSCKNLQRRNGIWPGEQD